MTQLLLTPSEVDQLLELVQDQPGSTSVFLDLIEDIKSRVINAIADEPTLVEAIGTRRHRVLDVDFREEENKVRDAALSVRLADVAVYDYERDQLLYAVTDVRAGRVESIEDRTGVQPPLTDDELDEAQDLVWGDERYAALRTRGGLDVVTFPSRSTFTEGHPRHGHRIFTLYFWTRGDSPRRVGQVAVDLSTQEVVPVSEAEAVVPASPSPTTTTTQD